ncbi:prephenate dehydratase [Shouchella clausii]|uniref:Prephenate dehydratase n=1 Tax=Shouchella clausii TaxID=79880 RepID=A0A268S4T1_SHOCL|nr:prephenate dehydratase [Shouchella clausii]PAD43734.1 prephenate dehydratase [Bacillus sp. 7520-S]MBU8595221.1 prephenate dehydratase [Shouchella clausii]MCY1103280.1 prephenate dehydratase [Shouchella clausii]MEB5479109.1 prephenate dehydratase [Shouchella clausii]MED4157043.1 prephenate dehydratase [Shouchella clausii]
MKKVGFLGPKGTFTEMAAYSLFPKEELVPLKTIPKVLDLAFAKGIDYAVVPIENAIEGTVNITLDYLIHHKPMPIVASISLEIAQHLLFSPNKDRETFVPKKVVSHPQAIAQCHQFLQKNYPEIEIEYADSTGSAAAWLAENPDADACVIANAQAASTYRLAVAQRDIHDFEHNRTRFVVLTAKKEQAPHIVGPEHTGDKTTLMVTLPSDFAGALHQVLSAFAWRKLNLSKIESRPTKTGLGNYFFLIDIDQLMDDVLVPGAIAELTALGCKVEVLGSYATYSSKATASIN